VWCRSDATFEKCNRRMGGRQGPAIVVSVAVPPGQAGIDLSGEACRSGSRTNRRKRKTGPRRQMLPSGTGCNGGVLVVAACGL